jgi:hypothetical protein
MKWRTMQVDFGRPPPSGYSQSNLSPSVGSDAAKILEGKKGKQYNSAFPDVGDICRREFS